MMYPKLHDTIKDLHDLQQSITAERKKVLEPLIDCIQEQVKNRQVINLTFICTHNSRRSHFAQIWTQVAAVYFATPNVNCYSAGTEETALFPLVGETLKNQGLKVFKLTEGTNPIYAIKYKQDAPPIIGFSKTQANPFNPEAGFVAIMTCDQADEACPFVPGAAMRIPVTYTDPKHADDTALQQQTYRECSRQIATEMWYVFSKIKNSTKE